MFTIGCVLYLPNHIALISRRVYYYFAGDAEQLALLGGSTSKASEAVVSTATDLAGAAFDAVVHTAVGAQKAAERAVEGLGLAS